MTGLKHALPVHLYLLEREARGEQSGARREGEDALEAAGVPFDDADGTCERERRLLEEPVNEVSRGVVLPVSYSGWLDERVIVARAPGGG